MTAPDTIVLIHGFWVTPRSWEGWKAHYEAKGFTVHTPGYPGFEGEVEALRADPTPIADLTVEAIANHLDEFIGSLDTPTKPILMGHSADVTFEVAWASAHSRARSAISSQPGPATMRCGRPS